MSPQFSMAVLGIGATLLLAGVAALWRAASLRGKLNAEWRDRVELTYSGLSEQAAGLLLQIQVTIRGLVAGAGEPFDPIKVLNDPAGLEEPMERFMMLLRTRNRLRRRFEFLLWIGPMLLVAVPPYMVGIIISVFHFWNRTDLEELPAVGLWLVGVGLTLGLMLLGMYAYLQHKLSGSEILSSESANEG